MLHVANMHCDVSRLRQDFKEIAATMTGTRKSISSTWNCKIPIYTVTTIKLLMHVAVIMFKGGEGMAKKWKQRGNTPQSRSCNVYPVHAPGIVEAKVSLAYNMHTTLPSPRFKNLSFETWTVYSSPVVVHVILEMHWQHSTCNKIWETDPHRSPQEGHTNLSNCASDIPIVNFQLHWTFHNLAVAIELNNYFSICELTKKI